MAKKNTSIFPKSNPKKWLSATVLSFFALVAHEMDFMSMEGLNPAALGACSTLPIQDELPKPGYGDGEALYLIRSDGSQPQVLVFPLGERLTIRVADVNGDLKVYSGVLEWVEPQRRTLLLKDKADGKNEIHLSQIKMVGMDYENLRWQNVTMHGAVGASIGMLGVSAIGGLFALAALSSGEPDGALIPTLVLCLGAPLAVMGASFTSAGCCAGATVGYLGSSIDDARFSINDQEWHLAASPQELTRDFPELKPSD